MYQEMTAVKDQVVVSLTNQVKYFPLHPGSFSYYTTIPEGELNSGGCAETRSVEVYIQRRSPTLSEIVIVVFTKSIGENFYEKGNFFVS